MYTITQRVKILPLALILKTLGYIDILGATFEYMFTGLLSASVIMVAVLIVRPTLQVQSTYLSYGITYYLYGSQSVMPQNSNVLGATKKREYPFMFKELATPEISAKAALVADVKTGKILFSHNMEEELAPASTTKLMTALVALDLFDKEEILEVPGLCTTVEGSKAGFKEGSETKVENILRALLVGSAGDAACVLATAKTSITEFVDLMNEKAQALSMEHTAFTNPIGLDGIDGSHHSTAYDLYQLSKFAMENEFIRGAVLTKELELEPRTIYNTNKLLWEIPNTVGVKTGTTVAAGEVLIYEYKDEIKDVVIIVMGSADRFTDTRNLLNWTFSTFLWE